MRKALSIRKITDNSKEYKATIRAVELGCPRCRPNHGCNSWHKRKPKTDKYKDKRKGKT